MGGKDHKEPWWNHTIFSVIMISQLYTQIRIHHIICFKCVQIIIIYTSANLLKNNTMQYHCNPSRMAKMESTDNSKYLQEYRATRTGIHCEKLYLDWNCLLGAKVMVCQSQDQAPNGLTVSARCFGTLPHFWRTWYYKGEPTFQLRTPRSACKELTPNHMRELRHH